MSVIFYEEGAGDKSCPSLIDALWKAEYAVKWHPKSNIRISVKDKGLDISKDEILYLIAYYAGFPNYDTPNEANVLQVVRNRRERIRKNIGIVYRTEYRGVRKEEQFLYLSLVEVLRQVARDLHQLNYDAVSVKIEETGLVVPHEVLKKLVRDNGSFPEGVRRPEPVILNSIKQFQEEIQQEERKETENQRKLQKARMDVQSMLDDGRLKHRVVRDWLSLNQAEITVENNKLSAIIEYHIEGDDYFKFYLNGRDQVLTHKGRNFDTAKEIMAKLLSGLIDQQ